MRQSGHLLAVYAIIILFLMSAMAPAVFAGVESSKENSSDSEVSSAATSDYPTYEQVEDIAPIDTADVPINDGTGNDEVPGVSLVRGDAGSIASDPLDSASESSDDSTPKSSSVNKAGSFSEGSVWVEVETSDSEAEEPQGAPGLFNSWDLSCTNIEVTPKANYQYYWLVKNWDFEVDCTIVNTGVLAISTFTNTLFIDGDPVASGTCSVGGGGTVHWRLGWFQVATGGYHTVSVTTDTNDDVQETNENDNHLNKQVFWDLPDLLIAKIWLTDSAGKTVQTFVLEQGYKINWAIVNDCLYPGFSTGTEDPPTVSVAVDGVLIEKVTHKYVLYQDGAEMSGSDYLFFPSTGLHEITITADCDNKEIEGNPERTGESNNALSKTIQVVPISGWSLQSVWITDAQGATASSIASGQYFRVSCSISDSSGNLIVGPLKAGSALVDGSPVATGFMNEGTSLSAPAFVSDLGQHNAEVRFDFGSQTVQFEVVKAKWTILCYFDGDNNLDSYIHQDALDTGSVGSSHEVSVAIQRDSPSGCWRTFAGQGAPTIQSWDDINMGDPAVLIDFVTWGMDRFEADHYLVNLNDHGGSWVGCCWDDGSGDLLTLDELGSSFFAISLHLGRKVEVVWCDQCLMDSIEVAYQLKDYVGYISGSETVGWTNTWNYRAVMNGIRSHPDYSAAAMARWIMQLGEPVDDPDIDTQCMSVLDLSRVQKLSDDLDALSQWMIDNYAAYKSQILAARAATSSFEGPYSGMTGALVDLVQFCTNLYSRISDQTLRSLAIMVINDACQQVGGYPTSVVIDEEHTSSTSYCRGLSIYFPISASVDADLRDNGNIYAYGNDFAASGSWVEFLQVFLGVNNMILPSGLDVSMTSPISGNVWKGDKQITWTGAANNDVSVTYDLELSLDDGASWQPLTSITYVEGSTPTAHTYVLSTQQFTDSTSCQVKIDFEDASGETGSLNSGSFIIDNTAPTISIGHSGGSSTVTPSATDATSGVSTIWYRLGSSGFYKEFPRTRARYFVLPDPTVEIRSYEIWAYSVDRAGNKAEPVMLEVCYLSVVSDFSTPSSSGWYNHGDRRTSIDIAELIVPDGEGARHVFKGWKSDDLGGYTGPDSYKHLTMVGPITETAIWETEYYLTVVSDHGTPAGEGWYVAGSTPVVDIVEANIPSGEGSRYAFQGWSSGEEGGYSGVAPSHAVEMIGPITETAIWSAQHLLTVVSAHGSPTGGGWFDEEATTVIDVGSTIVPDGEGIRYIFLGWRSIDPAGYTGTDVSRSIAMTGPVTEVVDWQTQFFLEVTSTYGDPSGEGWYDQGSTASLSLPATEVSGGTGIRHLFLGWSSDDAGGYSGLEDSWSIAMTGPIEETAAWKTQYHLDVASNHGIAQGTGWYDSGSYARMEISPTIVNGEAGVRYVFTGWHSDEGGYNGPEAIHEVAMIGPFSEAVIWETQYHLTVISSHGSAFGDGWYSQGSTQSFGISSSMVDGEQGIRYVFKGWSTADYFGYIGADLTHSLDMTAPITETAIWETEYLQSFAASGLGSDAGGVVVSVTVTFDDPLSTYAFGPSGGSVWAKDGTEVSYAYSDYVTAGSASQQYWLQGSTLTSGPASGFTANCPNAITWSYAKAALLYTGDLSGQYSDSVTLRAILTEGGSGVQGRTISFDLGSQTITAVTDGGGIATAFLVLDQSCGGYTVQVSCTGAEGTTMSDSAAFGLTRETASLSYTGDTLVFTRAQSVTVATVHLAVNLVQESDGCPGDLTKAKVTFLLFSGANQGNTPTAVCPASIDFSGYAHCYANLRADVWMVKVMIMSEEQYWAHTSEALGVLTVSLPDMSASGGGWIVDLGSVDGIGHFGFSMTYDKKMTPKGTFTYAYRGLDGYDYIVKSTSWQGGGLSFTDVNKAFFTGKCVIQKIDATTGLLVQSWGNSKFSASMTDVGATDKNSVDSLAVSFSDLSGSVINRCLGTTAMQIPLGGGNIIIRCK
jgi:hypothetical protein